MVAGLARRFGDLELAEDAAADAFVAAVEHWPREGVPPNPGAWLTTTATRKAIDRVRRDSQRGRKHDEAQLLVVSHQKRTMEAADCLYGVSMPPGGSSRVVSQRVRDEITVS